MKNNKLISIVIMFFLAMLVLVSTFFVMIFTYAGNSEAPDATVTYTKNNLSWDIGLNDDGIARLRIFGDPEEGEDYPTIDPSSGDTYRMRLKNNVSGKVNYFMYIYCDNPHSIPLKFELVGDSDMKETEKIPTSIANKEIISATTGKISGRNLKDFEIQWKWDSESDFNDTVYGDNPEDLLYTVNVMLVIEDNNSYGTNNSGVITVTGQSTTRLMHRHFVSGYPDGTFLPEKNMNRAEIATIFARILANYNEDEIVETYSKFNDIDETAWYARYVSSLEKQNIISGYSDGSFKPNNDMTRAEFTAICVRYFEKIYGTVQSDKRFFIDVKDNHWAFDVINKAASLNLISGYSDNTFKPDNYISRVEAVTIVNRLLNRKPDKNYINSNYSSLEHFSDVQDNSYWGYYEIMEASNDHIAFINNENEKWEGLR